MLYDNDISNSTVVFHLTKNIIGSTHKTLASALKVRKTSKAADPRLDIFLRNSS